MTYEEALKELKHEIDMLPKEPPSDFVVNENVWFKEHEKIIDAHNKAIEALEKQIPKEHHHTRVIAVNADIRESICPSCLGVIATNKKEYPKYCTWCGQAIDWSE